ncbi:hypothetical protein FIBSPDRAFT_872180 [Athelia psychrophila]|uniref:Uncharacterized protein n=1 Tax=Athelia psychrophila TaxID=1759441 RepID=A0A165ZRL4_9AGAM|nr:hypothetical protein FIBSPDRAFT_872180 [Fibularhizoctonia sp. CBS 109695]
MRLTCLTTVHRITRLITQQRELILTQDLIGRLIDRLSSEHSSNMHAAVPELVNGVISKGAPSPGAAHRDGASKLVGYALADRPVPERVRSKPLVGIERNSGTDEPFPRPGIDESRGGQ